MPSLPIDGCARIAVKAHNDKNKQLVNVFAARFDSGDITHADLREAANAVKEAVMGSLDSWSTTVVFDSVTATDLSTGSVLQDVVTFDPDSNGTNGSDPLPASVSMVFTLHSGFTGRSNRGRVFMFGACESDNTDGKPNVDYVTHTSAYLDNISTALGLVGWLWAIASTATGTAKVVINAEPRVIWRNQRRRQDDVGV